MIHSPYYDEIRIFLPRSPFKEERNPEKSPLDLPRGQA